MQIELHNEYSYLMKRSYSRMNMRSIFISLVLVMLGGCNQSPRVHTVLSRPHTTLSQQLHKIGLPTHYQQHRLTVLMPAAKFFKRDTMQLTEGNQKSINKISRLIQVYSKKNHLNHIRVVGYPNHDTQTGLALSHQYAVIIAGHMWNKGVPARISSILNDSPSQLWIKQHISHGKQHEGVVIEIY